MSAFGGMCRETKRRRFLADKSPIVIELIAHTDVERANIVSDLQIADSRQDQSEIGLAWLVSPRQQFPHPDGEPTGGSGLPTAWIRDVIFRRTISM
jgi:hypothetical protein